MMLYYISLESLEERYSGQWAIWFPEEFFRQGLDVVEIKGTSLCDTVEVGTFLDINSTMAWKSSQINQIAQLFHQKKIKDGDVFFLADAEMFGMEGTIRYLADLNGLANVRIYGFAHAGSYTFGDFVEKCAPYARHYEHAWNDIFNGIFVGSQYHKNQLMTLRGIDRRIIAVTGNPYNVESVRSLFGVEMGFKVNRVIHTNRPDPEKNPWKTLDVFESLKKNHPDWEFVVTTGRKQWGTGELRARALVMQSEGIIKIYEGISKLDYFSLLAQSKVLTGNTLEENFGYCILEAMLFDTIPVVENKFSHPELVQLDAGCLFSSWDQEQKIAAAMKDPFPVSKYADKYQQSLSTIVKFLH